MYLKPAFEKYEKLLEAADYAFQRVANEYPDCVKCVKGCSDCCYALFDLTLVEALYLNQHFNKTFDAAKKQERLELANKIDRKLVIIKRNALKELQKGKTEEKIFEALSTEKIRCPLLNQMDECDLYDYRPITCRFYGIPTAIGGKGHTCGKSDFVTGKEYPTVNLDAIHSKLLELSKEIGESIQSRYIKLHEMLVPVSMAILTTYDEEYLGVSVKQK